QLWCVIEGFQVGRAAGHVQVDHTLGTGREVQRVDDPLPAIDGGLAGARVRGGQQARFQKRGQSEHAHAGAGASQEGSPGPCLVNRRSQVHGFSLIEEGTTRTAPPLRGPSHFSYRDRARTERRLDSLVPSRPRSMRTARTTTTKPIPETEPPP